MPEPDGAHFDRVAAVYERGRPAYPDAVYDLLGEQGLIGQGVRVLEIGAGSGLATAALLARGCHVDAIEPGGNFADALRRLDHPRLSVREAALEETDLPAGAYDAVVAATSWHWIDGAAALPRLHAALRPGGRLAVWWAVFGDPDWHSPFRDRVEEMTRRAGIGVDGLPRPLQTTEPAGRARRVGMVPPRACARVPVAGLADFGAGAPPVYDVPHVVSRPWTR